MKIIESRNKREGKFLRKCCGRETRGEYCKGGNKPLNRAERKRQKMIVRQYPWNNEP
jgi:hypothetical protein